MTGAPESGGEPRDGAAPRGVRTAATVRWVLVAAMAIAAAASLTYKFGWLRHPGSTAAHDAEQEFLWQCPMHPAIVQDHPGECPICGMTLVRRSAAEIKGKPAPAASNAKDGGGVPGLAAVDLTPERIQLIGMRTAQVARAPLGDSLHAVGVVAANERGLAQIPVRFSGWVQQLLVAETGRHVKKGEVLATIYSPDVIRAEQELLTARGWAARSGDGHAPAGEGTPADLGDLGAAARRRLELLGIAPSEIDAVVARGKPGDSVPIRSPVDGFVTARNVVPGAAVQPGPPLFEVANLSRVWVLADVFEQDAARLHVGQKGTLELAAYPGERFEGRVQFIYPTVAAATRTLKVRLELPNRSGPGGVKLRPGMYGNVSLALPAASGLVVPVEALVDTGDHQYLFVATGAGHFEPRAVKAGARAGDNVQITSGVSEGETVVATGNFLIDSESRLRAAIAGQGAAAPAGGSGPDCARDFDARKFPDKADACRACDVQHRGMGTMADDCKNAIAKPWR